MLRQTIANLFDKGVLADVDPKEFYSKGWDPANRPVRRAMQISSVKTIKLGSNEIDYGAKYLMKLGNLVREKCDGNSSAAGVADVENCADGN